MFPYIRSSETYDSAAILRRREVSPLRFEPLTIADIPAIRPYLNAAPSRTCDFTIGGLLMWADYFNYTYAIYDGTLFVKGVTENDVTRTAFSLPVGKLGLDEAVELLRDYCRINGLGPLLFSAIPAVAVEPLRLLGARKVEPLEEWSDYLYEADALASLSGKKLSKKRNHVNRFMIDNPGYELLPLTPGLIHEVRKFMRDVPLPSGKPALADIEREQVMRVLDYYDAYGFTGVVLKVPGRGIVAFSVGEVIGDTLYVHIEKMAHDVAGAGETVNKLFASCMLGTVPHLRYINREEAVGDPGLRNAKESYHPCMLLGKYNVMM